MNLDRCTKIHNIIRINLDRYTKIYHKIHINLDRYTKIFNKLYINMVRYTKIFKKTHINLYVFIRYCGLCEDTVPRVCAAATCKKWKSIQTGTDLVCRYRFICILLDLLVYRYRFSFVLCALTLCITAPFPQRFSLFQRCPWLEVK